MTQHHARACWITAKEHAELRDEALPEPRAGELLIEARYSAISRGTESLIFKHAVLPSEHERMRAPFQSGTLPGPVKYGYASVGRVMRGDASLVGRSVFCLFPHQTAYVIARDAVALLPEGVPEDRAVLAANMETALNALWDAQPLLGQRIVVVGAGVVGSLVAYLAARIPGCEVCLVDVWPERAQLAAAIGCSFALPDHAAGDADLVIHASGSEAGLRTALLLARTEGTVLELSWFGDREVSLPLGAAFHSRRLTIRASQVGAVAASMRSRLDTRARLALALRLLRDDALDALISSESAFETLPQTLAELSAPGSRALCHRIHYSRK